MTIPRLNTSVPVAPALHAIASIDTALRQAPVIENPIYTAIISDVARVTQEFKDAYEAVKAESELEDFDNKRDPLVRSFFSILESFSHYFDEVILNASTTVTKALGDLSASMIEMSFGEESIKIHQLLNIVETPEVKTAIEALPPLSDVVSRLKVAQEDFDKANQKWAEVKGKDVKSASYMKREAMFVVNKKLVGFLNVAVLVDGEHYSTIAGTVDSFVKTANSTV